MATTAPLNVIALISGGKDSLFSILHCLAQGHKVIALANLYPEASLSDKNDASETSENPDDEDINSYMYQTVGHTIIPLYERALKIPLYRQAIIGSAVNTNKEYSVPKSSTSDASKEQGNDETESLVPLLQRVMADHPEANAISTGAILSTYQRTRVESVAIRLGLTPLSYLWQYPVLPPFVQSQLLEDMRAVGQDARIIKVASGGLDDRFLWENVADERVVKRLEKAVARFGRPGDGAVLGEGGEFESLAIDGPGVLWKGRIEVGIERVVKGEGGSAVLKLGEAKVVEKEPEPWDWTKLRLPELLEAEFKKVLDDIDRVAPEEEEIISRSHEPNLRPTMTHSRLDFITRKIGNFEYASNITAPGEKPEIQIAGIVDRIKDIVEPSSIVFSTILLRKISDFPIVNAAYGSLFKKPNPPARVTISCGGCLPEHIDVVMSIVAHSREEHRSGLHVQSQSYWAPANIGPYSQAISVPLQTKNGVQNGEARLVHIAGQIPLIPSNMQLIRDSDVKTFLDTDRDSLEYVNLQAVLALQHLWRIGRTMNVDWWIAGVAFMAREPASEVRARLILKAWKDIHAALYEQQKAEEGDDENDVDVWDMKHGLSKQGSSSATASDVRPRMPRFENVDFQNSTPVHPPCLVVRVESLPRGAAVEWMSTGVANCQLIQTTLEIDGIPVRMVQAVDRSIAVAVVESPGNSANSSLQGLYDAVEALLGEDKYQLAHSHSDL
ncbi:adenine nucleotide alpha hydrolases-like protein [Rhizodiscina lignyota]|uniref:Diphthine--ammonia ligase n=1 Tax=Rhizodiscina lignyota TaxID=1504668 RepID=A0A9P4IGB2_9PEZI|nr:adenine nucleotide alpha hydrolases-like protein [Rhizodiscina lignyota]